MSKPNDVLLTHRCIRGVIVNMLMMTLGFLPVTMRKDRDDYVDIKFDNIKQRGDDNSILLL